MQAFTSPGIDIVFVLCTIAVLLAGLLLLIDSIWRVEDRFDRYLKLLAVGFAIFLIKKILIILGFDSFAHWILLSRFLDLAFALFFLTAQTKLFIMIRRLSGEAKQ